MMTQIDTTPPPILPPADEFAVFHQRRTYLFTLMTIVLAIFSTVTCFALGGDSLILAVVPLITLVLLTAIWHYPRVTFYILFTATLIFETSVSVSSDAIVERVPFFWNLNTIVQVYANTDFKALPINFLEVLILLTTVCAGTQAAFSKRGKVALGPLFWPIAAYIGFVTLGWINGMLTGGDFKISLQEVRPQFYFMLAYLMAVNIIKTPLQINRLYWIMVCGIGLKAIIYTIRRNTVFAGLPLPDQGVGSHEEAFLFDSFIMLMLVLSLCGIEKHIKTVMWLLLPVVVFGNLATNRRAGTAAFIIVFPILLMAAYRVLPSRRKMIGAFSLIMAIVMPIYYLTFRNSDSILAQPARAISSQFDPGPRDANSNAYRDAENADLMATIRLAPIQGYGYGKRMLHVAPIADISKQYDWWDIMTHNQVLWVWMRVGTFGMVAFWIMVAAIIIQTCLTIRSETASIEVKALGIFSVLVICMLMFFGLLDLQFSNYRDMLFTGFWVGVAAAAPQIRTGISSSKKEAVR
jgi:hypothetical protein